VAGIPYQLATTKYYNYMNVVAGNNGGERLKKIFKIKKRIKTFELTEQQIIILAALQNGSKKGGKP